MYVMSGRGKKDTWLVGLGSKLQPSILHHILLLLPVVMFPEVCICLIKLDESKKPQTKNAFL